MSEIARRRALQLQRSLGTRVAAGYLRNRGISIEEAIATLAMKGNNNGP